MKTTRMRRPPGDDTNDLGFGSRLSRREAERLLNRNGTFNVRREGNSLFRSNSVYHWLLTVSWAKFHLLIASGYFALNLLFAMVYYVGGEGMINGGETTTMSRFWNCFFFSVETFATIGYGALNPRTLAANWVMTIEAFSGLLFVAMATGLLFARFSRPNAKILFSNNAIIAPFKGGQAFMFRMINVRASQLIHVNAQVIFSKMENEGPNRIRRYHTLSLDRDTVTFFPLHWTVVHHITDSSPLYRLTHDDLARTEAEFLVLITAIDETYSQTVHARSSYRFEELVWGARFRNMFNETGPTKVSGVNIEYIHEYVLVPLD